MIDRRTLLKGLAVAVAAPVLAGCDAQSRSDAGGKADDAAGALRYALRTPRSIDPLDADASGLAVVSLLFEPLMRYDFAAGELAASAAESFSVNGDATAFTFRIREGLTFSNGDAVGSADFKRAWERLVDPDAAASQSLGASPWGYLLTLVEGYDALSTGTADGLSGVTCPDDRTLQVALSRPYADFALLAAHPVLSPVPSAALDDLEGFHARPVGNGAFALAAAWDGKADIELSRVDADPDAAPVVLALAGDTAAGYNELEAGDVDVAAVPAEQLEEALDAFGPLTEGVAFKEGSHLLATPEPTVAFLTCNMSEAPFDDADVRRAVSLAIDRDTLCDKVYRGAHQPASSPVPPCVEQDGDGSWPYATYDPERARQLLELGYPADEDGTRDLELEILCAEGGANAKLLDAVAADLKAVGIAAKVRAVAWEELVSGFRTGAFSCGLTSWTPDAPALDGVLYPLFRSGVAAAGNYARYLDAEVDASLDAARSTADAAARRETLSRVSRIVGEACPVIPLTVPLRTVATSDGVQGVRIDPYGRPDLADATF